MAQLPLLPPPLEAGPEELELLDDDEGEELEDDEEEPEEPEELEEDELEEELEEDELEEELQELSFSQPGKFLASLRLPPRLPTNPPSVGFCPPPLVELLVPTSPLMPFIRSSRLGIEGGVLCAETAPESNKTVQRESKNLFINTRKD